MNSVTESRFPQIEIVWMIVIAPFLIFGHGHELPKIKSKAKSHMIRYCAIALWLAFSSCTNAAGKCIPPNAFSRPSDCEWQCAAPSKRLTGSGAMKKLSICSRPFKPATYYDGRLSLTGTVEKVESTTFGNILVFYPDVKSSRLLPTPRQSVELWFANGIFAAKLLAAPSLSRMNKCWRAPARIEISGLLVDLGDQDGNHDWTQLQNVLEIGKYRPRGCIMN